ncbi:chromatin structure-remodeling complex subunit RSC7 [Coemansia sp. RSA 2052]|nr:chromatin structure-remodeling complex subunit RSC7 [Coemansia sp. RSA 2052]
MGYRYEPTAFADGSVILPFSDVDMDKVREDFRKRIARRRKRLEMSQKRIKVLRAAAANKPASDSEDMDELSDHSIAEGIELSDGDDDDDDDDDDEDEDTLDASGETKVDANGNLLGGRSYICAVFRSPCRKNRERLYIPAIECCRYTGLTTSKIIQQKHPHLRRFTLTTREREILHDNLLLAGQRIQGNRVFMYTARSLFKVFGADLVLNGRHVVDDYCKDTWERRNECRGVPPCVPGQVIANMQAYQEWKDNFAQARPPKGVETQRRSDKLSKEQLEQLRVDCEHHFPVVGSWVELMDLVRAWNKHRKAVTASVRAGTQPPILYPGIARPELPPMASDDGSSDSADSEDEA